MRPQHRARLRDPGIDRLKVVLAGPTLEPRDGTMNGTLLVVESDDLETVQRFVDEDPYVRAGVYGRVEIRPFACGLGPLAAQPAASPPP